LAAYCAARHAICRTSPAGKRSAMTCGWPADRRAAWSILSPGRVRCARAQRVRQHGVRGSNNRRASQPDRTTCNYPRRSPSTGLRPCTGTGQTKSFEIIDPAPSTTTRHGKSEAYIRGEQDARVPRQLPLLLPVKDGRRGQEVVGGTVPVPQWMCSTWRV
jgi:hypothetical protein